MNYSTVTSRQFNQDTNKAKKASRKGPVFITNRGRPEHVLLSIEDYQRLAGGSVSIVDQLGMPGAEDIELDIPRVDELARAADLS